MLPEDPNRNNSRVVLAACAVVVVAFVVCLAIITSHA
jgi:hypothetical protein